MTKVACEYCATEDDCIATEHTMDCIFCTCQDKYPTEDTCQRCLHDRAWCTCSLEERQKEVDELMEKCWKSYREVERQWKDRLKLETE